MANIKIEINAKYREALDLLKQVIPDSKGEEINKDSEMVEALIDSFMVFIQEQAGEEEGSCESGEEESTCCGGGGCGNH